ncbi:MAG: phospholipid/cholesterol/gamma-HCH transport system substrate-binding protein [Acidimicrobiaceae bacterium]|jgi:phospholipid/cholesterol/gamma-HCH transport system substrate-binding protein
MIRTAIKFGVFVAICLSFTLYLAFTIGNISIRDPLARDYYTLNASFDDVTGLLPNDNVKIAGVVVGKVKSISVVDGRAKVSFTVKKSIALADDTTAAVRWRNLIGQRFVYLYPGRNTVTRLVDGKDINATQSVVDLGQLFNELGPIVSAIDEHQVNDFLDTITQALDGNTDKLGKAIDDLGVLMKGLGSRDESIGRLVANLNTVAGVITNRDQQIRVMLDNLVLISAAFSANTDTLDTALQEFGDFGANLHAVLANNAAEIDRIISNLDLVTAEVVGPKLAELDSALKGVDQASRVIFNSSRLGEWLNQAILCFRNGPPDPTTVCHQPPGTVLPASANDIGGRAPSSSSGVNALQQLLVGSAR